MRKEYYRILAPFADIADVEPLKNAGAHELYCGYVPEEFTRRWPSAFQILNRRGEGQSFTEFGAFKKAAERASKCDLPVYAAINGLYTPEQYPLLLELVDKTAGLKGVKGVIIADLGLLLTLRKNKFNKEIHISVGGSCFNSGTADFFCGLGAKRIILDRHLTLREIESIVKEIGTKIDFEIFILREPCGGFIDGLCSFFHCFEDLKGEEVKKGYFLYSAYNTEQSPKGCNFYFDKMLAKNNFKTFNAASGKEIKNSLKFQPKKHNSSGCRICDLYGLKNYPIKSLKIVGRGVNPIDTVKSVKLVAEALSYLTLGVTRADYQRKCRDLFSGAAFDNKHRCTRFDCYFSPHWARQ
jgi:putative protease